GLARRVALAAAEDLAAGLARRIDHVAAGVARVAAAAATMMAEQAAAPLLLQDPLIRVALLAVLEKVAEAQTAMLRAADVPAALGRRVDPLRAGGLALRGRTMMARQAQAARAEGDGQAEAQRQGLQHGRRFSLTNTIEGGDSGRPSRPSLLGLGKS